MTLQDPRGRDSWDKILLLITLPKLYLLYHPWSFCGHCHCTVVLNLINSFLPRRLTLVFPALVSNGLSTVIYFVLDFQVQCK